MGQNEDIPYTSVDDFASSEPDNKRTDIDQANKSVLVQLSKDIGEDIKASNSFTVINLPANATRDQKVAAFDEMAIHKGLAMHLARYKQLVDDKIKELV